MLKILKKITKLWNLKKKIGIQIFVFLKNIQNFSEFVDKMSNSSNKTP